MLFFGRKKKESVPLDLSWLRTDMHSHVLPGIDDGSPDVETSVQLIKGLQSMGYQKLIATPHIFWEIHPNTPERISESLASLRKGLEEHGMAIELHAAAEYYIDEHFEGQLRNKAPLLTISENKVLVEFSMVTAPLELSRVIFDLQIAGYQPVIAHPERYTYLLFRKDLFDELKEAGCMFQLNLLSLTGYYGKQVLELAEYLCKKEYYDLAGTDLHHERHLEALQKLSGNSLLARLREGGVLRNHGL
jgi:tyrosine-protein phosphatase YwqE